MNIPEPYRSSAERVYTDVSARIVRRLPAWDFALGRVQIERLRQFLQKHLDDLGDNSFALELTQADDSAAAPLTAHAIAEIFGKPGVIAVGPQLKVLGTTAIDPPADGHLGEEFYGDLSEGKVILYYEQRAAIRIYANGYTCSLFDPRFPGGRPAKPARFSRRAEEYEKAIIDHYREQVRDWNGTDHWEHRPSRTLRTKLGRAKTEDIFVNSLFNWLHVHLLADVKGKVGQVTSDETDIEITAPGMLFVVEVKWLGSNSKGTTYTITRVAEGLRQVRDYLRKQASARQATLLTYDGRSQDEFDALPNVQFRPQDGVVFVSECAAEMVPPRATSMILFLRSTTASQT